MSALRELADRLEGLEKVATPGEWERVGFSRIVGVSENGILKRENADFITALRNAAPQIVKALRRLDAIERAMDVFANERVAQRINLLADEIEKGTGNG